MSEQNVSVMKFRELSLPSFYGLEHSNKDFSKEDSYGKNTFTTAFPIALSAYAATERKLPMNYIKAVQKTDGAISTEQVLVPLSSILGIDPRFAYYSFEDSFSGYDAYAVNTANRSDIVVKDNRNGKEICALEVKLVAIPTSSSSNKPIEKQSCELVVRPPSIEQLCFSVAASYGKARRQEIGDIIVASLGNPIDYEWAQSDFMMKHRHEILDASINIVKNCLDNQLPLVLMGTWRTNGQEPELADECFDSFYWSNLAFLQLFTNGMIESIEKNAKAISRPERALIWFIKSMFDYSAQGSVQFERTHSLVTFGAQTDKAGSFTDARILKFVSSDNFIHPRIRKEERSEIINDEALALLKPERRLDAVLMSERMKELFSSEAIEF